MEAVRAVLQCGGTVWLWLCAVAGNRQEHARRAVLVWHAEMGLQGAARGTLAARDGWDGVGRGNME